MTRKTIKTAKNKKIKTELKYISIFFSIFWQKQFEFFGSQNIARNIKTKFIGLELGIINQL